MYAKPPKIDVYKSRIVPLLPNPCRVREAVEIIRGETLHNYTKTTVQKALIRWGIEVAAAIDRGMDIGKRNFRGRPKKKWDDLTDPPLGPDF